MNYKKKEELEKIIHSDYSNTVGIVVQKNGELAYEKYFNGYTAASTPHVYSVTKSVFSILFGIALDKKFIRNVNQKILDFFPEYRVAEGEETIQRIAIRDMLTMTVPYKYTAEPYEAFFMSENWLQFALALLGGGKGQIGEFLYSGIVGTHILSGVLAKATGVPILEFATEHLFSPMEIYVPRNVMLRTKEEHLAAMSAKTTSGWAVDPQGLNPAGWSLFFKTLDMAKIGQLYLNGGLWNGRQIIPALWVTESSKEHSRWGSLPYGYLWWVIDGTKQIYAAMGDGGNIIYINTQKQMVVSISAFFAPNAKDRIGLITDYIEPLFEG